MFDEASDVVLSSPSAGPLRATGGLVSTTVARSVGEVGLEASKVSDVLTKGTGIVVVKGVGVVLVASST